MINVLSVCLVGVRYTHSVYTYNEMSLSAFPLHVEHTANYYHPSCREI